MQSLLEKWFGPSWKSSVSGILNFIMVTLGFLSTWLASLPSTTHVAAWATSGISLLSGLTNVWLHFLMIDAGTVLVTTPSNPVPRVVPSTEVPLTPNATVVTKEP